MILFILTSVSAFAFSTENDTVQQGLNIALEMRSHLPSYQYIAFVKIDVSETQFYIDVVTGTQPFFQKTNGTTSWGLYFNPYDLGNNKPLSPDLYRRMRVYDFDSYTVFGENTAFTSWLNSVNPAIVYANHKIRDYVTKEIAFNPYPWVDVEPNADFFIKYTLPRDGFADNAYLFQFCTNFKLPLADGYSPEDYVFTVTGGDPEYDYRLDEPDYPKPYTFTNITNADGVYAGSFNFERALLVGDNTITVTVTLEGTTYSLMVDKTVTRLDGFVDVNGDGLDDRTGRPDGNSIMDNNTGTVLLDLIERKLGMTSFKNSFNAIKNLSTTVPIAPVIKIPIGDIFHAATSRFYSGSNPFSNQDLVFVDFGYLEQFEFFGMSVINYFRMLISMGMIWFTVLAVWRKLIPDKAVD